MSKSRLWTAFLTVALVLALVVAAAALAACGGGEATQEVTSTTVSPAAAETTTTETAEVITELAFNTEVVGDSIGVLGLGAGPKFWPDRNGTAFVLFADGAQYMIDCGPGTPQALYDLGQGFSKLQNVFLTHLHFDHTVGYADLLARGYQTRDPNPAGAASPLVKLTVWGPPGTQALSDGFMAGLGVGFDLHNWQRKEGSPWLEPTTNEINLPETGIALVYEDRHVKVTATRVDHDVDVADAYAYRFDILAGPSAGKSVVFSGDRAENNVNRDEATNAQFRAQFRELAQGATVLVHEVGEAAWASQIADPNSGNPVQVALYYHLVNSHTDVNEIPALAKELNVGTVVLNHYGNIGLDYTLQGARDVIYQDVMKANETAGYTGTIIAPMEGQVIPF